MDDAPPLVRLARPTDVTWLDEHDGHLMGQPLARKVSAREVYVAEVAGERVGLLRADWWWSRVPFIAHIWVLPTARRDGVGRALVDGFGAEGRDRGEEYVFSSVTDGEEEPLRWHLALGFVECGYVVGIDGTGSLERILRRAV